MAAVVIDSKDRNILPFTETDGVDIYYGRIFGNPLFVEGKFVKGRHYCWVLKDNADAKMLASRYGWRKL